MSHFFNAISTMFPAGERFFVRNVRRYAEEITDPKLQEQVDAFVRQEAQHYSEHDAHTSILLAQGFGFVETYNRLATRGLTWMSKRLPRFALACTIATEHITAVFADQVLQRADLWLEPMVPEMRRLWRWHGIEETEHKAVAYDVYETCIAKGGKGGVWLRRWAMSYMLLVFFGETFVRHSLMLLRDRQFTPRVLWRGMRRLWGRDGMIRSFHPHLWQFFRADFHPWQLDNSALVDDALVALRADGFATA